ncbi:MAG: ABC transporter ATP-binding protein [Spirochaetia bacterium]
MLEVRDLEVAYDGAVALRGISFHVNDGETVALIGANGAGKTTTLKAISGLVRPRAGRILWNGQELSSLAPHKAITHAISHCREGRQLFADMTLRENLLMGAYVLRSRKAVANNLERVLTLFPEIGGRLDQIAGTLSGGEQQMAALMRALISDPRLLLLDEPSLGLSPIATKRILSVLPGLSRAGTSVLLVEQNAAQALEFSNRAYILQVGEIRLEAKSADLASDKSLQAAYMGELVL